MVATNISVLIKCSVFFQSFRTPGTSGNTQLTVCGSPSKHYFPLSSVHVVLSRTNGSRHRIWPVRSIGGGSQTDSSETNPNADTRLVRAIKAFRIRLSARIKELRKDLPMKVIFFLVGFYCATAFSTVIGQTGDWDILSAGLAVVVVEAIGALMYRASLISMVDRVKGVVTTFNYWKAGLTMGLFLDAFKYEIDTMLDSCNPFDVFDVDIFPDFW